MQAARPPTISMTRCRRLLLLGFVTSLLAACTAGSDEPIEVETPRLSHEEAKAQVPLHGDDRRPLIWRVDSFSDPDAAEAAEAAQYFFVVFEVLGRAKRPVDAAYLKLLSHFSTDEWFDEVRRWYPPPNWSPAHPPADRTGPRWVWILDVNELPDNELPDKELMVSLCIDTGWYGWNPDGNFKKVESYSNIDWGIMSYRLRKIADADESRWRVHGLASVDIELTDEHVQKLIEACSEWAGHDWIPGLQVTTNPA